MFKKKDKTNYDRINGFVEGIIFASLVLKEQKAQYGDLASIKDMLFLINDKADDEIDRLFELKDK